MAAVIFNFENCLYVMILSRFPPGIFPCKHAQTRAKLLIDALLSGLLFHGEAIPLLDEMKRLYVRHIFKDWKVVKAFDCSAISTFKTSTIKALHSVLDKDKIGLFPSPSAITRARQMNGNKWLSS